MAKGRDIFSNPKMQHATQSVDSFYSLMVITALLRVDGKLFVPDDKELIDRLITCAHYAV